MARLLRALARATTRRPRASVAVLLLLLVGAVAVGTSAGGDLVDDFTVPGIESQRAQDVIADRFPGQAGDDATVVLSVPGGRLTDREHAAAIGAAMTTIERQPHVAAVSDPLAPGHLSRDGRTAFATVAYDADADDLKAGPRERLERATARLERNGVQVAMAGPIVDAGNAGKLPVGELAGVVLALALMLCVLRSARAALASLVTAIAGVALGFALLGLAANGADIPTLAPTMAAMLGLGAGIDYALLSAARHQEELRAGATPRAAAVRMNATAGHSAVTAAAIVLVSISGLLVTGIPFVGKVGVAAGAMVLVTALVTVVLLPPLFAAAGAKMLPRRARPSVPTPTPAGVKTTASRTNGSYGQPTAASRTSRPGWAVRRPRLALLLGVVLSLVLIAPATGLELGQPADGNLPADQTQRQAYDRLAAAFGPGFNGPLVVALETPRGQDGAGRAADALRSALADTPGVASVGDPVLDHTGDAALVTLFPASSPQDERTSELVRTLRGETVPAALDGTPATAHVGGRTARLVDEAQRIADRLPLFAIVVVGLSLLLLAAVFRSPKIAALSAVFNLVSIAAAYGVVHVLFQTDAGTGLLGVDVQPVVPYTPLFMFAILFGLSTDYNVFLLSRVREEWQRTGQVAPAVAVASARTRWTITAAGAIMIAVFLGFATDPDTTVKMTGVGLASAILVDVTLVRLVLAPASLTLLGDRLWSGRKRAPRRRSRPASGELRRSTPTPDTASGAPRSPVPPSPSS